MIRTLVERRYLTVELDWRCWSVGLSVQWDRFQQLVVVGLGPLTLLIGQGQ